MMDEIFDRVYQDNRGEMNAGINRIIGRFSHAVGNAFQVLNRIEYSAPWAAKARRVRCN